MLRYTLAAAAIAAALAAPSAQATGGCFPHYDPNNPTVVAGQEIAPFRVYMVC